MKITINRVALTRALKLAASTAEPKSPQPMLACVHLRAAGSAVHLTATDLTVSTTTKLGAAVAEGGGVVVDARAILDRVGSLAGDDVTIARDGSSIDVGSGRARFKVPCLPDRDFPKVIEAPGGWSAHDAASIVGAFSAALPAVCTDTTRFHLGGVFVDGAHFVATDGHRLIAHRIADSLGGKRIVPTKGVAQVIKVIGGAESCDLAWSDGAVFVRAGDVTIAVKLIDAQFPLWEQAVPTKGRIVAVDRGELVGVIDRARKVAGDSDAVVLSFSSARAEIGVSARHADRGEYDDAIAMAGAWTGADLEMNFNARYVADVLATSGSDRCELMMPDDGPNAQLMPFVVVLGQTRGTIMPMKPK